MRLTVPSPVVHRAVALFALGLFAGDRPLISDPGCPVAWL